MMPKFGKQNPLLSSVLTSTGVRLVDEETARSGLPLELLMEAAGRGIAEAIRGRHNTAKAVVLCGTGANGGDGMVAARWLHIWGWSVQVFTLEQVSGKRNKAIEHSTATESRVAERTQILETVLETMRQALRAHGIEIHVADVTSFVHALSQAEVVIDALYGSGFRPPLHPLESELVQLMNSARTMDPRLRIWAVDLPSGLIADRPQLVGETVKADHTVALSSYKPALLFSPTADLCGELELCEIGIPAQILNTHAIGTLAASSELATKLPKRPQGAHKGLAGRVGIVGGSAPYPGAPALAAFGALHIGAGIVTVIAPPGAGLGAPIEATRHEVKDLSRSALEFLEEEKLVNALAVGMGASKLSLATLRYLLGLNIPLVLDAEALIPELEQLLIEAQDLDTHGSAVHTSDGHHSHHSHSQHAIVLTPHPGEAARLLGTDTKTLLEDPFAAATALAERFHAVIVLKGGPSLVACRGHKIWVNTSGNPHMATGGMGDVLSGIIAGLLGQGLTALDAARVGVYLHGRAGDIATIGRGPGLAAHELAKYLPEAWIELSKHSTS